MKYLLYKIKRNKLATEISNIEESKKYLQLKYIINNCKDPLVKDHMHLMIDDANNRIRILDKDID